MIQAYVYAAIWVVPKELGISVKALHLEIEKEDRLLPAEQADIYRLEVSRKLNPKKQGTLCQYLTPLSVATFMASLFGDAHRDVVLLDPGAGTGTLTAAFVQEMFARHAKPHSIRAEVYELEPLMVDYLKSTLDECANLGETSGIQVYGTVIQTDFIQWGVEKIRTQGGLFEEELLPFTHCIMNPPYKAQLKHSCDIVP
jgi:adenine-specific DNA-methyltransferase